MLILVKWAGLGQLRKAAQFLLSRLTIMPTQARAPGRASWLPFIYLLTTSNTSDRRHILEMKRVAGGIIQGIATRGAIRCQANLRVVSKV